MAYRENGLTCKAETKQKNRVLYLIVIFVFLRFAYSKPVSTFSGACNVAAAEMPVCSKHRPAWPVNFGCTHSLLWRKTCAGVRVVNKIGLGLSECMREYSLTDVPI